MQTATMPRTNPRTRNKMILIGDIIDNTDDVLNGMGYSGEEVAAFKEKGAVGG